jgi:hypothetical protein
MIHEHPVTGIPIISPSTTPKPTARLIGYQVIDSPKGIICAPAPAHLSWKGWASCAVLAIVFWPVSCIPCCIPCCYDAYQIPVYEDE